MGNFRISPTGGEKHVEQEVSLRQRTLAAELSQRHRTIALRMSQKHRTLAPKQSQRHKALDLLSRGALG